MSRVRAIGGPAHRFRDAEICRKVSVDLTLVAVKVFLETLAPDLDGKKFRFVYCSGMGAEWDQNKRLLFLNDTRKIKVR